MSRYEIVFSGQTLPGSDLETVKANDCNLNISRYVDTTEAEEEIDIAGVIAEFREIKEKSAETETKLNEYLRELGFDEL